MNEHLTYKAVELSDILNAREKRYEKQKKLIEEYNATLISFTLNTPGPNKANKVLNYLFDEGCEELIKKLKESNLRILHQEKDYFFTGAEGYFLIRGNAKRVKIATINIEENHPLGRLFDLDVISYKMQSISRSDLNVTSRKCLVCNEIASVCARSRKHSLKTLEQEVNNIIKNYIAYENKGEE